MRASWRFPIRFKILVTFLLMTTVVVSLITFTMAKLFHKDKTAYIHDLTSVIALHTAEEARSLLTGYRERLQVFSRVVYEEDLSQAQKGDLLGKLFEDFQEFVAISIYEGGTEQATVYDARTLETAGLTRADFANYRTEHPVPLDRVRSGLDYIDNSTMSEDLPTFTMALSFPSIEGEDKTAVISAVIRLEGLLRLAGRSKVFETFILDSNGVLLAHTDPKRVARHEAVDWVPEIKGLKEKRSLGTTLEYLHDGMEMVGGFANVQMGELIAGVQIPKSTAYLTARALLNNLIGVSLGLLIISALLSFFWSRRITRPIEGLLRATRDVGKGRFDIRIDAASRDEIGDLAGSFNHMAGELQNREEALKQAQAALIQSEKMAAFGQLGAGIAHEVKNPLAGILGYAQLSMRKIEPESPIRKNLEIIEKETKRCKSIIDNLMRFARQEKVAHEPTDVNRVVEDTAAIVNHQMGINQIKLEKELAADLPEIMGSGNQIEQVLMNIIINAQQAMEGKPGSIKLKTSRLDGDRIEIRVSDTGPGMSKEVQARIFEPFFSTKAVGKGTGLGLSVTYGIIKDHKGEVRIESEPGQGAAFIITFPVADRKEALPSKNHHAS